MFGAQGDETNPRASESTRAAVRDDFTGRLNLLVRARQSETKRHLGARLVRKPARVFDGDTADGDVLGLAQMHVRAVRLAHRERRRHAAGAPTVRVRLTPLGLGTGSP